VCAYQVEPRRLLRVNDAFHGDLLVGNFSWVRAKLRLGELDGNRFCLVVRNVGDRCEAAEGDGGNGGGSGGGVSGGGGGGGSVGSGSGSAIAGVAVSDDASSSASAAVRALEEVQQSEAQEALSEAKADIEREARSRHIQIAQAAI
jgi:hypothetical protein